VEKSLLSPVDDDVQSENPKTKKKNLTGRKCSLRVQCRVGVTAAAAAVEL